MNFKNRAMSLDICKKQSVTSRELFKNSEIPCVVLIVATCEFKNPVISLHVCKKWSLTPRENSFELIFTVASEIVKPFVLKIH